MSKNTQPPFASLLAYRTSRDAINKYCKLSDSTIMKAMMRFVLAIRACFETKYLRQPTREDIVRLMDINEKRGFSSMFAYIDCMD